MTGIHRRNVRKLVDVARRWLRGLVRAPRVRGAVPPMQPGGVRLGDAEEEEAVAAVRDVIRSKRLFRYYGASRNPLQRSRVREFEQAFAKRVGIRHALAVNSGSSALVAGLAALGVGPGDEVIVPGYAWVSTASSALALGAVPIIAEVDDSLTLDVDDVRGRLSPHTRAVVAVHMRGAPARMDAIAALCREHGLLLVEDVAQAVGGRFRGQSLGTFGDVAAFSFQASKIITAGEGGLVASAAEATHLRAAMYHDSAVCAHRGVAMADWLAGVNLRMSELHAAVLLAQLARLDEIVADMRSRKAVIRDLVRGPLEERGAKLRTLHDADGDTATSLVFFLPDAQRVAPMVSALLDDNVPASRLYHDLALLPHDHVDLHVYTSWLPILRQDSWSRAGEPWVSHPRRIAYSAGMCAKTIDLLRRAVHVDVSPDLSAQQAADVGAAIAAAARRLL
ncbi:MAG: aminotransferase class I/II-fold pyridoxal phosphate-dependent enzyme [Betaproteobacteria bacterium]